MNRRRVARSLVAFFSGTSTGWTVEKRVAAATRQRKPCVASREDLQRVFESRHPAHVQHRLIAERLGVGADLRAFDCSCGECLALTGMEVACG